MLLAMTYKFIFAGSLISLASESSLMALRHALYCRGIDMKSRSKGLGSGRGPEGPPPSPAPPDTVAPGPEGPELELVGLGVGSALMPAKGPDIAAMAGLMRLLLVLIRAALSATVRKMINAISCV